jgi:PAS domain S-box-containing protein
LSPTNLASSAASSLSTENSGNIELRVRRELLDVVFGDQPVALTVATIYAAAIAWIVSRADSGSVSWLWFAAMAVTLMARLAAVPIYRRSTVPDPKAWEARFFAGVLLTGILWGAMAWYAYPIAPPEFQGAVVLLIGGVIAASSRTLASQLPAFCVYSIASVLPLIVRLAMERTTSAFLLGAFATLYTIMMLGVGRSFRDTVARTLRLRFENADLAAKLSRDIAAREAAEMALRASEERLRFAQYALDHAQDLVAIVGADGDLWHVNEAFCRYTGRSAHEIINAKAWAAFAAMDENEFRRLWREVKGGRVHTFDREVRALDGQPKPVEVSASYLEFHGREAVCMIARDLAPRRAVEQEKERMQQQLQENQRLESLGVLAGGIAHDFNNLLTAILGNSTLARQDLSDVPATGARLVQIERAANQAAGLCRQMLAYAGKGQIAVEPLDLSALVTDTAGLLETTVARRARLELRLQPGLPSVVADASQMRQIVINLVHNAAEAMLSPEGQIVVSTSRVQIDQTLIATSRVRTDLPDSDGVCLEVRDNGAGMDSATLDRIFEPFFTTKFTGRGLGLAAVLGIVRSHRGLLQVNAEPKRGTIFRIILPAAAKVPAKPVQNKPTASRRRQGRVLVVDDEEVVRSVASQALEAMGFAVETANDGQDALVVLGGQAERFHLLLIDMTMPHLDGASTIREIRRRGINTPVVMMTGFSEDEARQRLAPMSAAQFLPKPFDFETLSKAIEAATTVPET